MDIISPLNSSSGLRTVQGDFSHLLSSKLERLPKRRLCIHFDNKWEIEPQKNGTGGDMSLYSRASNSVVIAHDNSKFLFPEVAAWRAENITSKCLYKKNLIYIETKEIAQLGRFLSNLTLFKGPNPSVIDMNPIMIDAVALQRNQWYGEITLCHLKIHSGLYYGF